MMHNTQDDYKSKPLLRSRNLESAIHHNKKDFDAMVQEDKNQASTEGGIHHINKDFDAFIQEDEDRRREEQSHHVDIDNLDVSQETEKAQDAAVIGRVDNTVDAQDVVPNDTFVDTNIRPISVSGHAGIGYGKIPELETVVPRQKHHNINHVGVFTTLALVLTVMGILVVSFSIIRKRRAKKRLGNQVFQYVTHFDVEDIDLTKAATGGWHGTYKNNLRDGFVTDDTDDDEDFDDDIDDFDFDDDIEDDIEDDNDHDDIVDHIVYEDSTRSCRTQEIVFMDEDEEEECEEMLVGHKNIFFRVNEIDEEDIYYTSDDDLFRPVRSSHARSR
jgi:hypothetical protein